MLGFVEADDPIYQNTRKLVLSKDNPYYFSGSRAGGLSGIGGPHVGLKYAWPMSQIVRVRKKKCVLFILTFYLFLKYKIYMAFCFLRF